MTRHVPHPDLDPRNPHSALIWGDNGGLLVAGATVIGSVIALPWLGGTATVACAVSYPFVTFFIGRAIGTSLARWLNRRAIERGTPEQQAIRAEIRRQMKRGNIRP